MCRLVMVEVGCRKEPRNLRNTAMYVEGQWNVTTLKISLMNFPSSGVFKNTYDLRG